MRCTICGKSEEEAVLQDGIFESTIGKVCEVCAERENIPLLKKPTQEQLAVADKRYSVRERMENLSNPYNAKPSDLSKDQSVAHKNLNKLRVLPKKQLNDKLYDNYYWRLTLARRRRKMSKAQLAKTSGIPEEIIDSIEKGILPANFEEPIIKLEIELGVNLLKDHETNIKFSRINHNKEHNILKQVGEKIGVTPTFHKEDEYMEEVDIEELTEPEDTALKSEKLSKLSHGELDMSRRENLQDITLSDLQNMKKEKEEKEREVKLQKQHEDLFGEDVDFEDLESV